eukprot:2413934-Amphidinium_carterae.1
MGLAFWPCSHGLLQAAEIIQLHASDVQADLRRSSAGWHYRLLSILLQSRSYHPQRWRNQSTARLYIDAAMSESVVHQISRHSHAKVQQAARSLPRGMPSRHLRVSFSWCVGRCPLDGLGLDPGVRQRLTVNDTIPPFWQKLRGGSHWAKV